MNTQSDRDTRGRAAGIARLFATVGAVTFVVGCSTEPNSRVVSAPPPGAPAATSQTIVVPAAQPVPAATVQGQTIIVQAQPPAPAAESPPPRPSSEYVWVGGYWAWQGNRYVWIAGRWTVPPREGAAWVPPRWEPEGSGYRFFDGYWD